MKTHMMEIARTGFANRVMQHSLKLPVLTPLNNRISRDRSQPRLVTVSAKTPTAKRSTDSDVLAKTAGEVNSNDADQEALVESTSPALGWIGSAVAIGGIIALSIVYKDDLQHFLQDFTQRVEGMGIFGYFAYAGLYIVLETVAVPATPLTLAAGYLFGVAPGVFVVSISSTIAATLAFLIARYLIRKRATDFFTGNKQFVAIDKAMKKDGFKFVFLLRLSPLLPFAASNYLYGLTSVPLNAYIAASWAGMLPGTYAYISAGNVGRQVVAGSSNGLPPWEIGVGVAVTVLVLLFAGNFTRNALKELEKEET